MRGHPRETDPRGGAGPFRHGFSGSSSIRLERDKWTEPLRGLGAAEWTVAIRQCPSVLLQRTDDLLYDCSGIMHSSKGWTTSHNLAVIYIALAYGTDHDLTDDELSALTGALREWTVIPDDEHVQEVVMEAATAFLEGDARAEVRRSIDRLSEDLSFEQRRKALRDVMHIAEADGVVLEREQGLIHVLAEAWSLKQLSEELLEDTSAVVQRKGEDWGLIHELAFLYIVVAHSANNDLSEDEIEVMLDRLHEWQPEQSREEIRNVFRRSLQVYADEPEQSLIQDSVEALKKVLPVVQRLTVLDDLNTVAYADGALTPEERQLIMQLARAWDVNVRLNGQH